jgi:hypothetical protein
VVGEHDERVAVEQLVESACGGCERTDRVVAACERLEGGVRPVLVRGVVVVGQVVDEEVERVARDEPAADGRRIRVDRSGGAIAPRERCSRALGLEEVVEEKLSGRGRPEERQ